jgi:hypothetical protein
LLAHLQVLDSSVGQAPKIMHQGAEYAAPSPQASSFLKSWAGMGHLMPILVNPNFKLNLRPRLISQVFSSFLQSSGSDLNWTFGALDSAMSWIPMMNALPLTTNPYRDEVIFIK